MMRLVCTVASLALVAIVASMASADDSHKHAQALKDFVPDHPHLHDLVDKTHEGDLDAKHRYERESLSVRFNKTKTSLPQGTQEEHVVLHFLDEYTTHVTGGQSDHQFMQLEPFIDLLNKEDDLKKKLVELGDMLERAECDFTCLGDRLASILNESLERMFGRDEL